MNLDEAKAKIKALEEENAELKARVEELESRTIGRKKHDEAWQSSYNDLN